MKTFFSSCKTLETLKTEYRKLAMQHHPDRGGDLETMKAVNVEFDRAFKILSFSQKTTASPVWHPNCRHETKPFYDDPQPETAEGFRSQFYTEHGWAGDRYNSSMNLKEITISVREYVKKYKGWKFSITTEYYSGGQNLNIKLMTAPEQIWTDEGIKNWIETAIRTERYACDNTPETVQKIVEKEMGRVQGWNYGNRYDFMTPTARAILKDVQEFAESYRFSDCDGRIDYFNTNFWSHYDIGKWDKPLTITGKEAV